MSAQPVTESKCVIVVKEDLPGGLVVNAASVLSMTLSHRVEGLIGPDVKSAEGIVHPGIVLIPVPVLRAGEERLEDIRAKAATDSDVFLVGFTGLAQECRNYEEYIQKMAATSEDELDYVGIGLFGPRKTINRLTGSLPLVR